MIDRDATNLAEQVPEAAPNGLIDAVADVVGGTVFEAMVPLLRRGGRFATSGAISGPIAELDLRILIYRDLYFAGATVCPPGTMAKVVALINEGRSLLKQLVGGQARANKQDGVSPEDTTPLPLVFNLLGFKFETPGSYTVSVELAGESSGHIPLKLRAVPDSG